MLSENCLAFIEQHENDLLQLIETLCGICAQAIKSIKEPCLLSNGLKSRAVNM